MSIEGDKLRAEFKRTKKKFDINLYDKILDLRKFEIENFWKRTLFFWGTIAIIYAGYFNAKLFDYQIIIPLIGLLFNVILSLSTRGSKYWQEHWESMALIYENELKFDLFKYDPKSIIDNHNKSRLSKPYRFSVSKLTMLLSDLSTLIWLILWLKELVNLIISDKLRFDFFVKSSCVHWFTVMIISIHILLIGYFVMFIRKGNVYHKFK